MEVKERYLMHKDVKVAKLLFVQNKIKKVLSIYDQGYIPVGTISLDINNFQRWDKERCIPSQRISFFEITNQANIKEISEFAGFTAHASLTDCYWFASNEDLLTKLKWKDINFYDNIPTSNIGEITLYDKKTDINNFNSPDLTTSGNLPKARTYIHKKGFG